MALFNFKWIRKFVRRRMKPIPESSAETWKKRLSVFYMLVAWNAFGVVCYSVWVGKSDWAKYHGLKNDLESQMSPAQQYAKLLGIQNSKVFHVSGFKVNSYELKNTEEDRGITNDNDSSNYS